MTRSTCPELTRAKHGDLLYYRCRGPGGTVVTQLGTVAHVTKADDGHAAFVSFTQQAMLYSAPFLARLPENADLVRVIASGDYGAKLDLYDSLNRVPKKVEVDGSTLRVWPKQTKPELTMCED